MISSIFYDGGLEHKVNQDAVLYEQVCVEGKTVVLAMVCDGIGGLEQGEYASYLLTNLMKHWFYQEAIDLIHYRKRLCHMQKSAYRMLHAIWRQIRQYGREERISLGTTVTLLFSWKKQYFILQVGDSRAYMFGKQCKRLTQDDIDEKGNLTKCIGSARWPKCQIIKGKWKKNQAILLCTDGYYKKLKENEIKEILNVSEIYSEKQLQKRMCKIGKEALRRGEMDNMSAIYMKKEQKTRSYSQDDMV